MLEDVFDYIDGRMRELLETEYRPGFYVSRVTNAVQSFRRSQLTPEWLDDGALEQARRISSPLLDVIPAVGTRVATLSQDGVPEYPAWVGKIWDDEGPVSAMTAWLRANLQEHPGHVELGAEDGVRVRVGSNTEQIDETSDGEVVVESEDGDNRIRLKPDGSIVVESSSASNKVTLEKNGDVTVQASGTVDVQGSRANLIGTAGKLARGDLTNTELGKIQTALNAVVTFLNGKISTAQSSGTEQHFSPSDSQLSAYSSKNDVKSGSVYGD